ncbi:helix-turn-helix domain-containing protein [Moritella dasanensis]|uniref:helix-turn-helix domain-containing protein n=1 Tax=Moritella dasanensis TaxID=428031 RepID=UPI0002E09874|nr:helix-turn-helix domain-containing protein [Moritella dasanensis]
MTEKTDTIAVVKREDVQFFIGIFEMMNDNMFTLLREANIPGDIYNHKNEYQYLPETTINNLVKILGTRTTKEDFGLLLWSACKEVYIPKFVAKLTQTDTLKSALDEFCQQLQDASSGANLSTQYTNGQWWLVREKSSTDERWFKYTELFSVIFINELLKSLTGGKWQPVNVGIQYHDAKDYQALPELSQAQFYIARPVTAFSISDDLIHSAVMLPTAPKLNALDLSSVLDKTFSSTFKLAIKPYLSMGKLPIKLAAEVLNINVRTIQRRLDKEGITYSKLVEGIILDQILELLSEFDLSITLIASKMGYSDSAHFTRAFKRQMQMTPRQYRKMIAVA